MNQPKRAASALQNLVRSLTFAALFLGATANAQIVSFEFSGTIQQVTDPGGLLPADITAGVPYSGIVTYDTSRVTDFVPGDSGNGVYRFQGSSANDYAMNATVGTHTISWNPTPTLPNYIQAYLLSNHLLDYGARQPQLDGAQPPGSIVDWNANVSLWDTTSTALSSDALPTSAPVLGLFDQPTFYLQAANGADNYYFGGPITSITPVPEPASAALAAAVGLLGLGLWRRSHASR